MSKVCAASGAINVHGILANNVRGCTGPSELKLQITITTDKTVLELKQAIAEKSDVEADRQRLIYSGASSAHVTTQYQY